MLIDVLHKQEGRDQRRMLTRFSNSIKLVDVRDATYIGAKRWLAGG